MVLSALFCRVSANVPEVGAQGAFGRETPVLDSGVQNPGSNL